MYAYIHTYTHTCIHPYIEVIHRYIHVQASTRGGSDDDDDPTAGREGTERGGIPMKGKKKKKSKGKKRSGLAAMFQVRCASAFRAYLCVFVRVRREV